MTIEKKLTADKLEYLKNIKNKIEIILRLYAKYYCINKYIEQKDLYEVVYHEELSNMFENKKKFSGFQYKPGYEKIPEDYYDWVRDNFPLYLEVHELYYNTNEKKSISKSNIDRLEEIYRFILNSENSSLQEEDEYS